MLSENKHFLIKKKQAPSKFMTEVKPQWPHQLITYLAKSLGRRGCTTQYIPPLGSVRIQQSYLQSERGLSGIQASRRTDISQRLIHLSSLQLFIPNSYSGLLLTPIYL